MSIFNKENFKNILPTPERIGKGEPYSSTEEMINDVKSLPKSKSRSLITGLVLGAATFFSNQAKAQELYAQDKNINPTESTTKVVTKTKIVTDVNGHKTVEKYVLRGSDLKGVGNVDNTNISNKENIKTDSSWPELKDGFHYNQKGQVLDSNYNLYKGNDVPFKGGFEKQNNNENKENKQTSGKQLKPGYRIQGNIIVDQNGNPAKENPWQN